MQLVRVGTAMPVVRPAAEPLLGGPLTRIAGNLVVVRERRTSVSVIRTVEVRNSVVGTPVSVPYRFRVSRSPWGVAVKFSALGIIR